jgi:hypothetical protein
MSMKNIGNLHIFLMFLLLFALSTRTGVSSWNDASRMATIQSLVEDGTFAIDGSIYIGTGDKFHYNGHFYSDKPPLLALAASPVYYLMNLAGISFVNYPGLTYYLITLLTIGVLSSLALVMMRKIQVGYFGVRAQWADLVTLIAGTATLIWVYTSVFNNHIAAACLLVTAFFFLLRFRHRQDLKSAAILSLLLTLAGSIDFTCFLFLPAAFLMVLAKSRKAGLIVVVTSIPVLALYLLLNHQISGSIVPPPLNESLWTYQDSRFSNATLSGLAGHQAAVDLGRYAFHMIAGSRGLFTLSPVLVFSIAGIILIRRRKMIPDYRSDLRVFLLVCLGYIGLYVFRSVDYSGYAYGIRWWVSIMPLLCLPLAFLDDWILSNPLLRIIFMVVTTLSIMVSLLGYYAPFTPGTGYDLAKGTVILHEGIIRPGLLLSTTTSLWKAKFGLMTVILFLLYFWSGRRLGYVTGKT